MKKVLLIILIVLNAVGGIFSFFVLLPSQWFIGLLGLALTILNIIPFVVLIEHIEDIDSLRYDISMLQGKLRHLEKQLDSPEEQPIFNASANTDSIQPKMTAMSRWTCVKCGAVNREHSSFCENCGARFSYEQGQVFDAPLTKWKRLKDK